MDGFYDAVVADIADPLGQGRVRLQIPQVSGTEVTGWASPMTAGWANVDDQVYATFKGGDQNYPLFIPRSAGSGWLPLTVASGFQAQTPAPMVRVDSSGFLEFSGTLTGLTVPEPQGSPITCATLPATVPAPQAGQQQIMASSYDRSLLAHAACLNYADSGSTTSTTYVNTLTGSTHTSGPAVTFNAPSGGQVIVTVGAESICSLAAGVAYMSAEINQGDGGGTIVTESDDLAAIQCGTAYTSVVTAFPVTNLLSGMNYSLAAYYKSSSTTNTATFRRRFVRVDPVQPTTQPDVLVQVNPDRSVQVTYPWGMGGTTVNLTGLRARYA